MAVSAPPRPRPRGRGRSQLAIRTAATRGIAPALLTAITALAAALRFVGFDRVPANPYYDAAVRSMGMSWHNLFYGAFDPSGQLAVDKIPADLWLQVLSVKLLGFSSVALRLPEAIASTIAVPLLYLVVRRLFGRPAGLAAAAALAVLPASILTARSDTMDAVMTALLVAAAWLVVAGAQRRRAWLVIAGGAVAGFAFDVKLFESFVALPALALLALLLVDGPLRRRAVVLGAAAAAFVASALSWLVAWSLSPAAHRPFPIGSTNGSAWNVVFRFNGIDRLRDTPSAHVAAIDAPGLLRLVQPDGRGYGELVGAMLLAAVVLGTVALVAALPARGGLRAVAALPPAGTDARTRVAGAAWIGAWLVTGVLVLSSLRRMELRYLDAAAPAVAAAVGVAVATIAARATVRGAAAFALVAGCAAVAVGGPAVTSAPGWAAALALAGVAATALVVLAQERASDGAPRRPLAGLFVAAALVAVLAVPFADALRISGSARTDATHPSSLPLSISRYLVAHQGAARYEVASSSLGAADTLIVRDGRPVLMLTSLAGRPLLSAGRLARLVHDGQVRYAMFGARTCAPHRRTRVCSPVIRWAVTHAVDVSRAAHAPGRGMLWRLTTRPARG